MNNLIIGIAGGSGSGKTTLAIRLKERFGEDEVRLISHDSYYKRHDELALCGALQAELRPSGCV